MLKNIALKNTTQRVPPGSGNWQAESLFFANGNPTNANPRGRTVAAYNSSFFSHQDTIQTTGRAWFYRCYIAGDVDYIWGASVAALFENCELVSVKDPNRSTRDAVVFVSRTPAIAGTVGKGYVLFNSKVTTMDNALTWFGRNAGGTAGAFYDQAAVINTDFLNEDTGAIGGTVWRLDSGRYWFLEGANEHVGWKVFGNTVDGEPQPAGNLLANTTVMDESLVNSEYNGRRAILNRVFHIESGVYVPADAEWDLNELERAFGASLDASR